MQRAGLLDSAATSVTTAEEVSRISSISSELAHENSVSASDDSVDPSTGSDEEDTQSDSADSSSHGASLRRKHKKHKHGYGWHTTESSYSGRTHTDSSNSGLSRSDGTS